MATFHIDSPCCTPEELAKRTGIAKRTIVERIHDGKVPRFRLDPAGNKELILVNLVGLYRLADQQAESFLKAVNGG